MDRPDVIVGTPEDVIVPGAADVVVVCTNSFTKDVYDKLVFVMEKGMNVITSAEEMAYPQAQEPELAKKLDECAKKNGVSVIGTGINPGLIMDLLVILWTVACEEVKDVAEIYDVRLSLEMLIYEHIVKYDLQIGRAHV